MGGCALIPTDSCEVAALWDDPLAALRLKVIVRTPLTDDSVKIKVGVSGQDIRFMCREQLELESGWDG